MYLETQNPSTLRTSPSRSNWATNCIELTMLHSFIETSRRHAFIMNNEQLQPTNWTQGRFTKVGYLPAPCASKAVNCGYLLSSMSGGHEKCTSRIGSASFIRIKPIWTLTKIWEDAELKRGLHGHRETRFAVPIQILPRKSRLDKATI